MSKTYLHPICLRRESQLSWIVLVLAVVVQLMMGCSTSGKSDPSKSNLMTRTDRGRLSSGWQVDCIIDDSTATLQCFAGKYGTDGEGKRKVPFVVAFRQLVAGGGFVGPAVEPGIHTSRDLTPSVSVDGNPPITDMSSDELLAQLLVGSSARGHYQFWPSDPDEMEVDLEGFPEAYALLQSKIESEALLLGRSGVSARTISERDKDRAIIELIDQYGENASFEARRRAERMLSDGNLKGHAIWQEVLKTLDERSEPKPTAIEVDL